MGLVMAAAWSEENPNVANQSGILPSWDKFTHKRPVASVDAEGNALVGLSTIGNAYGVWGSASAREQFIAAQRGERLDSHISTSYDKFQTGDLCIVRGKTWTVVTVKDLRIHYRVGLRNTDERPVTH